MEKLKPCPFCGQKEERLQIINNAKGQNPHPQYWIFCPCCAAEGGWGKSESSAIKNWNMRTTI